ncbi:hypothetical protein [Actinokineospora sp. UTMC 2448]|uniref:hypothetical protein n=1 Tax=Actinokineospora sp. UTMC 2448 TaxID=2268449 RepID=UPI0021647FE5|nr:hypothetical protein [Actinokineospora sp. UTMC 2448]
MFRRALAPAAVLLLAAGCSGRANDLDTYYDDPTTTVEPTLVAPVAAPTTPVSTTTPPPTTTTPPVDADAVLLTDDDLAGEGVEQVGSLSYTPLNCAPDASAAWEYPSGSTLDQTVHVLPDAAGRVAEMRETGECLDTDGTTTRPDLPELGDDRFGWCFVGPTDRGCGAAIAKGDLLTVIVVKAGTVDRASAAVVRIAPLAADALGRA